MKNIALCVCVFAYALKKFCHLFKSVMVQVNSVCGQDICVCTASALTANVSDRPTLNLYVNIFDTVLVKWSNTRKVLFLLSEVVSRFVVCMCRMCPEGGGGVNVKGRKCVYIKT